MTLIRVGDYETINNCICASKASFFNISDKEQHLLRNIWINEDKIFKLEQKLNKKLD